MLYITFDDGPHPVITPIVLDELKKYGARATFFCVGKNVLDYPQVYTRILDEGHAVGNHSFSHLNGWKTANGEYLADIAKAKKILILICSGRHMERLPGSSKRFCRERGFI